MTRTLRLALGSLGLSVVVLAIKFVAYAMTGSVALYSDALESIINVATAVTVILAIRIAAQPPDAEHPYGHHKAEYLSAVVVGVMIVVAALAILRESYLGLLDPKPIDAPWTGLAIGTLGTLLNVAWATVLIREGKAHRSASLEADGRHLLADVVTSVAVLVGVVLVVVTGYRPLDPAIAGLVALHVLWSGWGVIRDGTSNLMDEAVSPDDLQRLSGAIAANVGEAIEAHALRTRQAGPAMFVDFHLVVPSAMSVGTSHAICDRLEAAIKTALPGATTTIHVEPESKAKHRGVVTTST